MASKPSKLQVPVPPWDQRRSSRYLQLSGPTFQAMLLHQPTAWTQCTVPALIHTRSPGR